MTVTKEQLNNIPNTDIGWLTWLSTQAKPIECDSVETYLKILSAIGQLHLPYGSNSDELKIWV
jgi:hypothetical protein